MASRWRDGACGGMQRPAVCIREEAGQVVVLQNLCSVFALAAWSSRELASGGACEVFRRGLRVLWAR